MYYHEFVIIRVTPLREKNTYIYNISIYLYIFTYRFKKKQSQLQTANLFCLIFFANFIFKVKVFTAPMASHQP